MLSPIQAQPGIVVSTEYVVPPKIATVPVYVPLAPPYVHRTRQFIPVPAPLYANSECCDDCCLPLVPYPDSAGRQYRQANSLRAAALPLSIISFFCGGWPCAIPAIALACQRYGTRASYEAAIILAIAAMLTGAVIAIGLTIWGVSSHFGLTLADGTIQGARYQDGDWRGYWN